MQLEDAELLYRLWERKKQEEGDSCPRLFEWLQFNGYGLQSYLQYEDEASQQEWLKREADGLRNIRETNGRIGNGI